MPDRLAPLEFFVLDEAGEPMAVDVLTWAPWFEANTDARIVAQTRIGEVFVSTVFIGFDLNPFLDGGPFLFETMVFPQGDCRRYRTRSEALVGHETLVRQYHARRTTW